MSSSKNVCLSALPIFKSDSFFLLNFVISSYVLHFNSLSNIIGKYFLSVHSLPFHFVNGFLCYAEASKFNAITVAYF